jgi:hypothetical protein
MRERERASASGQLPQRQRRTHARKTMTGSFHAFQPLPPPSLPTSASLILTPSLPWVPHPLLPTRSANLPRVTGKNGGNRSFSVVADPPGSHTMYCTMCV